MLTEAALCDRSLAVVGNINRDVKTSPFGATEALLADGESSVDLIEETVGGGGANSAFAAATLGAAVTLLGRVGDDALGRRLEKTAMQSGIRCGLARDRVNSSGTSLALTYASGHRHFISSLPANRALAYADLDLNLIAGCRHLLRADIWFSESMLHEGNKQLFEAAAQMSVPVSIDLNWDPEWGCASAERIRARKEAVRSVLPWVALAHGNVRELTTFADAPDLQTALERISGWGAKAVVVHLGEQGAGYYSDGSLVTEPPVQARTQVNAIGTGDVLSVCMMLLHGREEPIQERLQLANQIVSRFIEGKLRLIPRLAD